MSSKVKIMIADNPNVLALKMLNTFMESAKDSIKKRNQFTVALSGGSTPRKLYRMLAEDPYRSEIPWGKIHIFWVDERCVPENDPASNYGAAKKDFVDRISVPSGQIHAMRGQILPQQGAELYAEELKKNLPIDADGFPVLDMILLGIGKDGHIASLFPGQRSLEETKRWVLAVSGGDPNLKRLTLTYPVLNRAGQIVLMVTGKAKAQIVKTVFENRRAQLPAQKIEPINGQLIWILDRAAAAWLSEKSIR